MTTTRFHVPAMDCATEKQIIANRLDDLAGIDGVDDDLLERIVQPAGARPGLGEHRDRRHQDDPQGDRREPDLHLYRATTKR